MRAAFVSREFLTADIASFSFKPERPFTFTAGQFTELTLPGLPLHQFTISSSPHEELITITTRLSGSDFKQALFALEPGTPVNLSEPMGDFVLPLLVQTPLVFVAGGLGITPFHSIISWLNHTGEKRPIHLFYNTRSEDDLLFLESFHAADVPIISMVSQPSNAWGGERGNLTGELILDLEQRTAPETLYYLAGSEKFVTRMQKELTDLGVKHHQFVLDEFQGYNEELN